MLLLGRCVLIEIILSSNGLVIAIPQNANEMSSFKRDCVASFRLGSEMQIYRLKMEIMQKSCMTLALFHLQAIMNSHNGLISRALHLSIAETRVQILLRHEFFKPYFHCS